MSPLTVAVALLVVSLVSAAAALSAIVCPFQQALDNGQLSAQLAEQRKAQLIRAQRLLTAGHPAHLAWSTKAVDPVGANLFARANNLLLAKQFFVQQLEQSDSRNLSTTEAVRLALRQQADCLPLSVRCEPSPPCNVDHIFQLTGGFCNNLRMPRWGAAGSPYGRLLSPNFDDTIYTYRRSVSHAPLPSPRLIGNAIANINVYNQPVEWLPNHGSVLFGQFIAHDTGLRDVYQNNAGGSGLACCPRDQSYVPAAFSSYYGCEPIEIPADDPFYRQFGRRQCMSYVRSQPTLSHDCTLDTTEFSNSVSHFLDLSTIYGSDPASARAVRLFRGGLLNLENGIAARRPNCAGLFCYFTGDARAMINPPLALWHSVFIRFHNHLAERLAPNRGSDELVFQEARRLVTAVYQHIVVDEWLPLYVGLAAAQERGVSCPTAEEWCRGSYDATMDPSTLNEFATAAFRMFHVNIPGQTNLYNENFVRYFSAQMNDTFSGATMLETDFNGLLRGLLIDPMAAGLYPQQIRNELFNNDSPEGIGIDLLAVDIARGRDHGLRPYVDYLQLALDTQQAISDWSDLENFFSTQSIDALRHIYASVRDVDAIVGMLLEEKMDGLFAGPVARFIVEEQFRRSKFGDRFFYTLLDNPHPFSDEEVREINSQSMASVLCAVVDIDVVLVNAFEVESESSGGTNGRIRCDTFRMMNLVL